MFGFLLKKSFFDEWDNMLTAILLNVGFLLCALVMLLSVIILKPAGILPVLLTIIPGFFIMNIYVGAANAVAAELLESGSGRIRELKKGFFLTWKKSVVIAVCNILMVLIAAVAVPFYLLSGSYFGIIAAGLISCLGILWLCSVQFVYPLLYRTNLPFASVIKTSVMIAVENPLFSIGVLLFSLFLGAISVVAFLFIPGISAVMILQQNALKLRLYKYEWFEEHAENRKTRIPWGKLLENENEKLGKRTLRGMLFPWKD